MALPSLSEVIFPDQANSSFSKILGDLKRSNLSITNRLRSICQDAEFVREVHDILGLPLVANERCGSWYIDPELKTASAYFKSTDGHTGQWKFSTRRLNLNLLELVGRHDGCIIVDSTRRGKRMPDALSKTVPVWACVLNRALFPDEQASHALHVPPHVVSDSEKSQMEARIPEFLESFNALNLYVEALRKYLAKPLRPLWITQEDDISAEPIKKVSEAYHPVVCCTSSRRVAGTGVEIGEGGYIQGAGDDTENWAHGLTAQMFWRHADQLLATPEQELPDLIESLMSSKDTGDGTTPELHQVAPCLDVGTLVALQPSLASGACTITLRPNVGEEDAGEVQPLHLDMIVGKSKAASRALREALPRICEFAWQYLVSSTDTDGLDKRIVILCETGKDLSVGVALALLCWCFDTPGTLRPVGSQPSFNKTSIRAKLGKIMTAMPGANPSRSTLQSVNSFLMDWRK
ncbi:putative tRNA A64-2'-O-ribosylphosphate transferase [Echria macrotheca]|uniref:tRNA A64-2'-O-ribosylphosphate transferase n=1 Tax=Echria macrotheca TaxID=438768 RepID=A0AAJ0FAZ9_9PEZI|nr:putative tRNA A64-2'-O-ribosylphosphate transferase [Echria macrotheca]